jgi:hypothetical protein
MGYLCVKQPALWSDSFALALVPGTLRIDDDPWAMSVSIEDSD